MPGQDVHWRPRKSIDFRLPTSRNQQVVGSSPTAGSTFRFNNLRDRLPRARFELDAQGESTIQVPISASSRRPRQHPRDPSQASDRLNGVVDRKHRAEMLIAFGVPALGLLVYLVLWVLRMLVR